MQNLHKVIFGRSILPLNNICVELKKLRNRQSFVNYSSQMSEKDFFCGTLDIHKGISVDSIEEPCPDINIFSKKLELSLQKWAVDEVRGIWFHVALIDAEWIPILAKNGFKVHRGFGEKITLVKWLPSDIENRIPAFAHTMVGGGGLVLNERNQVLTVCESYKDIKFWKLPGGYVEHGEDLIAGVQREILEETNIKTKFVSVIAFRHSKQANFDCADFYFIMEFKALSNDIIKEDAEIEAAKWMEIDEYLNHPMVHENNRLIFKKYLECKKLNMKIKSDILFHPITKRPQTLFTLSLRDQLMKESS